MTDQQKYIKEMELVIEQGSRYMCNSNNQYTSLGQDLCTQYMYIMEKYSLKGQSSYQANDKSKLEDILKHIHAIIEHGKQIQESKSCQK